MRGAAPRLHGHVKVRSHEIVGRRLDAQRRLRCHAERAERTGAPRLAPTLVIAVGVGAGVTVPRTLVEQPAAVGHIRLVSTEHADL